MRCDEVVALLREDFILSCFYALDCFTGHVSFRL